MKEFLDFITFPPNDIDQEDYKHLHKADIQLTGASTFYCLPKIDKKNIPTPLRPVVETVGTKLHALGKWLAKELSFFTKMMITCIRDSSDVTIKHQNLGVINDNDYLFSTDAEAIYPNIDTKEVLTALLLLFETGILECDKTCSIQPLILALQLLMTNIAFQFGNTYYRQKKGTAISTPPASD